MLDVTQVGSWPRAEKLLAALTERQEGRLSREAFERLADDEVRACVAQQLDAGVDILVDGEQRRDNFYSFITDKVDGTRLMTLAELVDRPGFKRTLQKLDVPPSAIKNATCVGTLSRREPLAVGELRFVRQLSDKPVKVPLPGPYLLARSMWVEGFTDQAYASPEALADDVVKILREEILDLKAAGCAFVQLDEPVLSDVVFSAKAGETKFF
jgi:5-methyltetrahydropteroyltriglutamate--homocysteine methyltransferase